MIRPARRSGGRRGPLIQPGQRVYLAEYGRDATFTRSTEAAAVDPRNGWAFYDTTTPWPGVDVPRILPGGFLLIEGARTNLVKRSEELDNAAWAKLTQVPTVTADQFVAPDGNTVGDKLAQDPAAGRSDVRSTSFAETDSVDYSASVYLQATEAGEAPADIVFRMRNKANQDVSDVLNVAATWTRHGATQNASTGGGSPFTGLQEESTGVEGKTFGWWGAQAELGSFPTSPIRTAAAAVERTLDAASIAAARTAMIDGSRRWAVDFRPEFASTEIPAVGACLFGFNAADSRLELISDGTIVAITGGVTKVTKTAIGFSRHQQIRVISDPGAGKITVSGATSGNGTTTDTAWTWPAGALQVGDRIGGGVPVYSAIGRPWVL